MCKGIQISNMLFENVTWGPVQKSAYCAFPVCEHPAESLVQNPMLRFSQGLFCCKEQDPPKLTKLREVSARKHYTDVENHLSPRRGDLISSMWPTLCPPCCPISSAELGPPQWTTQQREREEVPQTGLSLSNVSYRVMSFHILGVLF